MKPTQAAIIDYLSRAYPRPVSVPELSERCYQTDVRKRVSELIRAGHQIEKVRRGIYVNYRYQLQGGTR